MPRAQRPAGVSIFYVDDGAGTPILLHTGGAGDHAMWAEAGYHRALGARRYVAMDHRGHGQSTKPARLEAHAPQRYTDDVAGVLDAAGVERAVLLGYSGGAAVLTRVADQYPDRCLALVALGLCPTPPDPDAAPSTLAAHIRGAGTRRVLEEMAAGEAEPVPPWLMANLCETTTEMFALPLEAAAGTEPLWDVIARVDAPSLLVCGAEEASDAELRAAAARMGRAETVALPAYGHLQAFWHADVTGAAIDAWLTGLGL